MTTDQHELEIHPTWDDTRFRNLLTSVRISRAFVVVANGVFDILHPGHVRLLDFAREADGYLKHRQRTFVFAAVNSDDSTRRLKGPNRPYLSFHDRATMLVALQSVDAVVGFDEDTPEELLNVVRPDLLVKGAEYAGKILPGSQHCGRIAFASERFKLHTSDLIEKIRMT